MHSRYSDGSLAVPELVGAVHAAGVQVFALTDHDTIAGLALAREHAAQRGLKLISGVEISTRLEGLELHILGYGFDPDHDGLTAALAQQREARRQRIPRILERLSELGVALQASDVEAAAKGGSVGRPHVAQALVARGYVRDTGEAFRRFLGDGQPAHLPKAVPTPQEAIAWIHAAGGKAVWAHPLARPISRPGGFELVVTQLRAAGLDGLELVHPSQGQGARTRIRKLASKLGLSTTGGSDFHGAASPGVTIGQGRGGDSVPASVVERLFA